MTWIALAPVTAYHPDLPVGVTLPYPLTEHVQLVETPLWLLGSETLKFFNFNDREQLLNHVYYCLAISYESDALGSPDDWWKGPDRTTKQNTANDRLHAVQVSLWLQRPTGWAFHHILHAQGTDNDWVMRQLTEDHHFVPLPAYESERLTVDDLVRAGPILQQLETFNEPSTLRAATQVLRRALTENGWALRYVTLWIILESLFGPDNPSETTYRLSQRVGFFLGATANEAKQIAESVRESYKWRSKIVHGLRLSKLDADKSMSLLLQLESFVRRSLVTILHSAPLVAAFNGRDREVFLEELPYSPGWRS